MTYALSTYTPSTHLQAYSQTTLPTSTLSLTNVLTTCLTRSLASLTYSITYFLTYLSTYLSTTPTFHISAKVSLLRPWSLMGPWVLSGPDLGKCSPEGRYLLGIPNSRNVFPKSDSLSEAQNPQKSIFLEGDPLSGDPNLGLLANNLAAGKQPAPWQTTRPIGEQPLVNNHWSLRGLWAQMVQGPNGPWVQAVLGSQMVS